MNIQMEARPDLAAFMMDDWFYGTTAKKEEKEHDLKGEGKKTKKKDDESVNGKVSTGRLTQEWLEEAKRMVADSPPRVGSPARFIGSPRFASGGVTEPSGMVDRRDPLSRSARRYIHMQTSPMRISKYKV